MTATVALISGAGRSGSTLLEILLNQSDDVVVLGEVSDLWSRGIQMNERCGCGAPFRDCEFWARIGERAFGGWTEGIGRDGVRLRRQVGRHRDLPWLLSPVTTTSSREALRSYASMIQAVHRAAALESGAKVVVDSSKTAAHALAAAEGAPHRVEVLHLWRRAEGVAHSWTRRRQRPHAQHLRSGRELRRFHPFRAATQWAYHNVAIDLLRLRGLRPIRVSYDDLANEPDDVVARLLERIGHGGRFVSPPSGLRVIAPKTNHGISGNPVRFVSEPLRIQPDVAWRQEMPLRHRLTIGAATAPLRVLYERQS